MTRYASLIALIVANSPMTAVAQDAVDDLFANPTPVQERRDTNPTPVQPRTGAADPVPARPLTAPPAPAPAYDPEIEQTQRLNVAVDARNRSVRESNAAAQADHERRMSEHAEWVIRLEREHQAETAAYEAELVRQQQAHEANVAAWRRQVEACQRGVIAACDPSTIR